MEMFWDSAKNDQTLNKCSFGAKSEEVEIAKLNYSEGNGIIKD